MNEVNTFNRRCQTVYLTISMEIYELGNFLKIVEIQQLYLCSRPLPTNVYIMGEKDLNNFSLVFHLTIAQIGAKNSVQW